MSETCVDRPVILNTQLELPLDDLNEVDKANELASESIDNLRADILSHVESLGLPSLIDNGQIATLSKEQIRASHALQRAENLKRELRVLGRKQDYLLTQIANGTEIRPQAIDPELVPVNSDDVTAEIFRFATLLWSVPVSRGFGRRMRYLVRDRSNGKLIGVFALGDPVFNLRDRDKWIGWNVNDRRARLVNVMDAYVVGAVPPYSQLLGGKLVASLIGSAEVSDEFTRRYGGTTGIISGQKKDARLLLATVTSALGRSSLYNRLKLLDPSDCTKDPQKLVELIHIGTTQGFGHFQLSTELFERLRRLLIQYEHAYANGHKYGNGPNWRMRVVRVGLQKVSLDQSLIRHGISREIYAMPMVSNFGDLLCGRSTAIDIQRPSAARISEAALKRWILPRADRCPEYTSFRRVQLLGWMGAADQL